MYYYNFTLIFALQSILNSMKKVFFIFFVLFTFNANAQLYLNEVIDSTKTKSINIDTLLTISPFSLDSAILRHLFIPEKIHKIVEDGIEGNIYYEYIFKNKKLIKSILKRGINNELDFLIKPQFDIVYEIIKDNINTDSNKIYKLVSTMKVQKGDADSIYFVQYYNHKIEFQIKDRSIKQKNILFNPSLLERVQLPINLKECIKQIDLILDSTSKENIKRMKESEFSAYSLFELGIWIEKYWGLRNDSTLSQYFNKMGIYNPDVMSGMIIDSYYHFLTGKKSQLKIRVKNYKDFIETQRKKEIAQYIVGDTVIYNFSVGYVSVKQEVDIKTKNCTVKGIIVSKIAKKNLLKIKLIQDCNNEGIFYFDIEANKKLKNKKLSEDDFYRNMVKIMKKGDKKWFYLGNWKLN